MESILAEKTIYESKLYKIKNILNEANTNWVIFAEAAAHCYGYNRKITDIGILKKTKTLRKLILAKAMWKRGKTRYRRYREYDEE